MKDKLPETWIKMIAKTVLDEREKQERKEVREKSDRRLRNTELLIKNYRKLSAHCENIPQQMNIIHQEIELDIFEQKIDLNEIMKSKQKTKMMMDYVDAMLSAYKTLAYKSGIVTERRYKILYGMYISSEHVTPNDLMNLHNVERSTLYKDLRKAIEEFSIVLFGIDAYVMQQNGKKGDKK